MQTDLSAFSLSRPPPRLLPCLIVFLVLVFEIAEVVFIANQIAVVSRRSLFNILSAAVWISSEEIPLNSFLSFRLNPRRSE